MELDRIIDSASAGDADGQYRLAMNYLREGNPGRARRWLERAVAQQHGPALHEAGIMRLHGIVDSPDPVGARALFEQAARQDHPESWLQLANMYYSGVGGPRDPALALKHLQQAVISGEAAAYRVQGLVCLACPEERWQKIAEASLLAAASRGDGYSCLALARIALLQSDGDEEQLQTARDWLRLAIHHQTYCVPLAAELGLEDDDDTPIKDLNERQAPDPIPQWPSTGTARRESLCKDPTVARLIDILNPVECDYLIAQSAPWLKPSLTVHPQTGKAVRSPLRTSDSMNFHSNMEDIVLFRIKERMAGAADYPVSHAEPFAVLRYRGGQEYRPHFDYINPASADSRYELANFGQRETTVFSYLAKCEGGETEFPELGLKVDPDPGVAVTFRNVSNNGELEPRSLHASLPVTAGEKWLATLWFRERPFL